MSCLRCFMLLLSLLAASRLAASDKDKEKFDEWRPVAQWEAQLKDVPGNSGAAAIQLYYGETRDDTAQFEFIYRRVKILNERGMKYADVEIDLGANQRLADLKARTIHPDGKIIDFSDRVFDKTILKGRGIKISAKSFTLPEVTVGSIVECKY